MSNVSVLLALTTYLVLASFFISVITEDVENITIGAFAFEEQTNTTFTTIGNISELGAVITSGTWDISATQGLYTTGPELQVNEIFFGDTNQTEGFYNNTYHIKNPNHRQYRIYIYKQSVLNNIVVELQENALYFRDGLSVEIYNYPGVHEIEEFNITTSFDTSNEWITVNFNSLEVFNRPGSISVFTPVFDFIGANQYFSGVYAIGFGFELHGLSSFLSVSAASLDFGVSNMLETMATVLFWNVDSDILPVWMNIIFIKIPGIGLFFIVVALLRGAD